MNVRGVSLISAFALTALFSTAPESKWLTNFEDAKKEAKKSNKVILADFTGSDWCGWCKKLKAEVFDKAEFQTWADKHVVLLEVDFPRAKKLDPAVKKQNDALAKEHNITGYPTILFMDAEGKVVGQSGYVAGGPEAWIAKAEEAMKGTPQDAKKPDDTKKPDDAKPSELTWLDNYEKAITAAKKGKKVVMADFTGSDWCGWCKKLKEEVFDTKEFKEWSDKNVILLEVDFPKTKKLDDAVKKQNDKLAKDNKIKGYPTIMFFDTDGKAIG